MSGHQAKWRRGWSKFGTLFMVNLFCNHHVIFSHLKAYFFSYLLRCCMRTYGVWFPRYALRSRLMFFCRLFSPTVGRGSSTLSTFLVHHMQKVNDKSIINNLKNSFLIESVWPSVSFSASVYACHFITEVRATHVFAVIWNTWWSSKNQIIPFSIMPYHKCVRIPSDMNITQDINWLSI